MKRYVRALAATLATAFVTAPSILPAKGATPAPFTSTGWRLTCASNLNCRVSERILDRANGGVFVALTVHLVNKAKQPDLIIQLPLGIAVDQPTTLAIGTLPISRYVISTCERTGCFAGATLSAAQLAEFRRVKVVKLAFQTLTKRTVTVTVPMVGFAATYAKMLR